MNLSNKPLTLSTPSTAAPVTFEWLEDGRIASFTVLNATRATVDQWIAMQKEVMVNWPADHPYLVLIDISAKEIAFTPYIRERVKELDTINPLLRGRVALILEHNLVAHMARIFLRAAGRNYVVTEAFFKRTDGLKWLKQMINPHGFHLLKF